ncbi:hypothetical protein AU468_02250 [Alkalispirochaeta sphaeroplastigenens]|uniref:YprB ribonuclease H-like domain-containing protein n=1 Tax=Alkalispirochaeta sphaeroplastigenens TaxID=1187066 RepID=A0A2S4K0A0_9SPIO|nr:ribonuclease H-like domain-containing protein [Alkalispirochaeta sphaeroplastigenens]POR05188.1 hypothetical protein AU468_02250 [Alkalispirochaeta sphaeroplastigenens]
MADLYERLRRIREQQRRGAGSSGGSAVTRSASAGVPRVVPPGPEWQERSPGVYYRSLSEALPRRYAHQISPGGVWGGLSPVFRAGETCLPLFLDVETSGLSGGSGSVAFLVGVGRFEGGDPGGSAPRLRVEQLFLADLGAEGGYVGELHRLLGESPCYVTYNGASFDIPVLRTRAIMTRRVLPEDRHLDLLPVTRRLFSPVIGSCRLSLVEEAVLGLRRHEDIPGSQVPERYQEYLRRGDPRVISSVLAHHVYDILHLAFLALHLNEVLSLSPPPPGEGHAGPVSGPDEAARLRLLWERGSSADRDLVAERIQDLLASPDGRCSSLGQGLADLQILIARSRQDWSALESALWLLYRQRGSRGDAVALAKFLEHRQGRFCQALQVVITAAELRGWDPDLEHRAARLRRKIERFGEQKT